MRSNVNLERFRSSVGVVEVLLFILTACMGVVPLHGQGSVSACASTPSNLIGLWSARREFPSFQKQMLSIGGTPSALYALTGGYETSLQRSGSKIGGIFPDGAGKLDGRFLSDGVFEGFFTQAKPNRSIYPFSSPVVLQKVGPERWEGYLNTLPDSFVIDLNIRQNGQGEYEAFFRDPQKDLLGGRTFRLHCDGPNLTFIDSSSSEKPLPATFNAEAKQISMRIDLEEDRSFTFEFQKDPVSPASTFYPVYPGAPAYALRVPLMDGDGWSVEQAASAGFDVSRLEKLVQGLRDMPVTNGGSPFVQALVVARHGRLVLDEYFFGFSRDDTHDLRSTGKSFTTTMMGQALGIQPRLTTKSHVLDVLTNYRPSNLDARKREISIENLLTMSSGLECDDGDTNSPGREERLFEQRKEADYYKYILDLPMKSEPGGSKAIYCSATINLLGALIRQISSTDLRDYFSQHIAKPLNFGPYQVNLSPNGVMYGGGGLYLRARDVLKLGQVYLDRGRWNGTQIVPEEWVKAATIRHTSFSPYHGYGFGFHVFENLVLNGRSYSDFEAEGTGGQLVIVIPKLDLVVTMLTSNYSRDMTDPERAILAEIVGSLEPSSPSVSADR